MVIFAVVLTAFVQVTLASNWLFGTDKGTSLLNQGTLTDTLQLVYNAWHKTELEQWLDDHDIPYPAAADRKDLADAVSKNWDKASTAAYETWEDNRLRTWLEKRAVEFDAEAKKDQLVDLVKSNWYGAKAEAESSWDNVKEWIFDTYDTP